MNRGRFLIVLGVLALSAVAPARAAVTLVDNDKAKLELEVRLMAWAMATGPDLIPDQDESIQDFFVRRARLILRARLTPSLELVFQMGQDNVGSKVLRDDGFRFKDALLNWKKVDALQVAVGQFKVPFLRQNLCSGFNQLLVDRSLVTALRPAIEGSRDQGAMLWGNHNGLQYRAALFDGSDQEDTNTTSHVRGTTRVSWNWFTPEPSFGSTGTTIGEKQILQVAVQADAQNGRVDGRDDTAFENEVRDYRAWAAEAFYDQPLGGGWALTLEGVWLERRDDYETIGLDTRSTDGTYAQSGVLFPGSVAHGRLQVAGRWEKMDTERGLTEGSIRVSTVGLNWYAKAHERKIQLDYGRVTEEPVDLDDNFYRLSVVATF
jgi:Phosphate-selective porin O and P